MVEGRRGRPSEARMMLERGQRGTEDDEKCEREKEMACVCAVATRLGANRNLVVVGKGHVDVNLKPGERDQLWRRARQTGRTSLHRTSFRRRQNLEDSSLLASRSQDARIWGTEHVASAGSQEAALTERTCTGMPMMGVGRGATAPLLSAKYPALATAGEVEARSTNSKAAPAHEQRHPSRP